MRSLFYAVLGVVVAVLGFISLASSSFDPASTFAGALIMLGLVLFFQGVYRRGQESKPKQTT